MQLNRKDLVSFQGVVNRKLFLKISKYQKFFTPLGKVTDLIYLTLTCPLATVSEKIVHWRLYFGPFYWVE